MTGRALDLDPLDLALLRGHVTRAAYTAAIDLDRDYGLRSWRLRADLLVVTDLDGDRHWITPGGAIETR